ncbi:MAG: hypothetical protein AAF667_07855 [Pseudomonadota bacterium]
MTKIAAIDAGLAYQTRTMEEPPFAGFFGQRIGLRDLPRADLHDLPCLMIPCRTNGARLSSHKDQLSEYIATGGTLVVMGETHPNLFIDGLDFAPEPTNFWWWLQEGADLGVRISAPDHPLMDGMGQADVTWHIHGTLTFEEPAETLVTWNDTDGKAQPILSVQRRGRGCLIVTTLDPIYHHGSGFMPATTAFLQRFLPALCTNL